MKERRSWRAGNSEKRMEMNYHQLKGEERSVLAALRNVGLNQAEIARELGRHRSTVWREPRRNRSRHDGRYRANQAQERTQARRRHSRRNSQFERKEWARVEKLLREQWSPEQVFGIWDARTSCRSATRRFTVMSGRIGKKAERCTDTCGARANRAGSGMDATTAGNGWRGSG